MKNANPIGATKRLLRWLVLGGVASAAFACALPAKNFFDNELAPFGMNLPPLDGKDKVDPRTPVTVESVGLGTLITRAELRDGTGKLIAEAAGQPQVTFDQAKDFNTRYTVKVTAEREWSKQSETREFSFTTVAVPKLEGPALRMVGPDSTVALHFDRPLGEIQATGDLKLSAELDDSRQNVRLHASDYAQDKTYPVQLSLKTDTGVPLPPMALELTTAPPLSFETNMKGQTNLGLALPLHLTFSEPLADKAKLGEKIQVSTEDGKPVSGRWLWQGQRTAVFTPQPAWPASSTILVKADPQAIRSARGGSLDKPNPVRFSTGTDRKLIVYLDRQQLLVMENGQLVRTFKVSTGKPKTPTTTGSFYIYDRYVHKTMRSDVPKGHKGYYEVENVPYTQFFNKDIAFHGAFWHNAFGHTASHGCVNMSTKDHNTRWPNASEDAGWLYRWASLGVPVTVLAKAPAQDPVAEEAAGHSKGEDKAGHEAEPEASNAREPVRTVETDYAKLPSARPETTAQ